MKKIGVVGLPGGWSSEALADAVHRLTGFRLLIDMEQVALDLERGTAFFQGHDMAALDGISRQPSTSSPWLGDPPVGT